MIKLVRCVELGSSWPFGGGLCSPTGLRRGFVLRRDIINEDLDTWLSRAALSEQFPFDVGVLLHILVSSFPKDPFRRTTPAMDSLIPGVDCWITGTGKSTRYHVRGGAEPDVTVLAGRCRFSVHRLVLSSHSPVFKAMLNGRFLESAGVVDLRALHHYLLIIRLLCYVYTGDYYIPSTNGVSPHELLEANAQIYTLADKYQMDGLKEVAIQGYGPLAAEWGSFMQLYLVKYIYTSTPPSDRGLRDLTKWALKDNIDIHIADDQWRKFMDRCRDFKRDMLDLAAEQLQEDRDEKDRLRQRLSSHGITP